MKTVFVLRSGSPSDYLPVIKMFEDAGWTIGTDYLDDSVDLVCFTGGSDVSPHLYGEENVSSNCDPLRDEYEREVYEAFVGKVPMVGICRGGQFLNVMNGGKMIQDISGHYMGYHKIDILEVDDGLSMPLSTVTIHGDHHQGIVAGGGGEILGEAVIDDVTEIVYYHTTRCLCFQPHPEWGHEPTRELFFDLMGEYLDV